MRGAAGPGRLRHRVLQTVRERRLWEPGQRVAVAVSGGMDSVALLDLLHATAGAHGGQLSVVTVDHGTREGSADDADFVEGRAAALGLHCVRVDLALGPAASEAVCRASRYAAFDHLEVDRVALAHHREDQAETVLLHLLRGAGTRGMAAMSWRRGRFVRPLLDLARAELERWCKHRGLEWREDPTNRDTRFLRNRVRHEVLPVLEVLRPGATGSLARSAALAAEDDRLLSALVLDALEQHEDSGGIDASWVAEGPPALVARALRLRAPMEASQVVAVRGAAARGSGRVQLRGGAAWVVDRGRVALMPPNGALDGPG